MISQGWRNEPLHKLPIQIVDGDRSSKYPKRHEFQSEGVVFLNSTNIVDNRLYLDECNRISKEKFESIKKGRTKPLDIVMTTRGSIGKVAQIKPGILPDGLINAQMLLIRADGKVIDPTFLYYVTCSQRFQAEVKNFSSGSAQPQIPITDLRQVSISYPSISAQQKIATILSAYDDLIENNLRRIKILEEMAQNLYREWFVKFRFPGHEQVPMVDSPLGKIPEGWGPTVLGDLACQVRRGVSPDSLDAATPYVGLEHIPRKSIALTEWGAVGQVKSTKLRFEENEILFGKIRPYFRKVAVAPLDGVCSSDTIVIKPKSSDIWGLVLGCISSEEFVAHATQTSQGTKMPRANWDVLIEYALPLPPPELRNRFNQAIESSYRLVRNLIFKNKNVRTTRDLLLPKLISGELDVSLLPIAVHEETA